MEEASDPSVLWRRNIRTRGREHTESEEKGIPTGGSGWRHGVLKGRKGDNITPDEIGHVRLLRSLLTFLQLLHFEEVVVIFRLRQ